MNRSLRFRLTIEVETPNGLRTGSSVMEVDVSFNDGLFKGMGNAVNGGTKGEAVVVDLGPQGLLFSLLTPDPARHEGVKSVTPFACLMSMHLDLLSPVGLDAAAMDRFAQLRGVTEIPIRMLPMFVRFGDIADPKTVERVDPEDLSRAYGAGFAVKRAFIEVVSFFNSVTTGIEKKLTWINDYYEKLFDGSRYIIAAHANNLASVIGAGDFKSWRD